MLHCAEFADRESAAAAAREVTRFRDAYAAYEGPLYLAGEQPYDPARPVGPLPEVLVEMGRRHGFEWPRNCGFLVKGSSSEIAVEHIGRLLFVYANAFELGGLAMEQVFASLGSVRYAERCHLRCDVADAAERERELAAFLADEDFDDAFRAESSPHTLFSITLRDASASTTLYFDGENSGEEAFIALLPQLDADDPRLCDDAP